MQTTTPTALTEPKGSHFDYTHQAWTFNGRYVRCGHLPEVNCACYGKLHEGQRAIVENLPTFLEDSLRTSPLVPGLSEVLP